LSLLLVRIFGLLHCLLLIGTEATGMLLGPAFACGCIIIHKMLIHLG